MSQLTKNFSISNQKKFLLNFIKYGLVPRSGVPGPEVIKAPDPGSATPLGYEEVWSGYEEVWFDFVFCKKGLLVPVVAAE